MFIFFIIIIIYFIRKNKKKQKKNRIRIALCFMNQSLRSTNLKHNF